ncbi:MAG: RnfABCDGE type electron transport complex subunit G [Treponema sp.]|nr:RnfABCDGE type electron transport complex subunit G [Treponema sp.]
MNYIIKPAVTLFVTAVITIAALSVVYNLTLEPIERQIQRTQEAALRAVLPGAEEFRLIEAETPGSIVAVYEGLTGGVLVGYVVELSPAGYGGTIDLVAGISVPDERITGMRILRHSETPGLGALAARENFYQRFDNRPLVPLEVVRYSPGEHQISAITSSTITTRAVTGAVNEAIRWFNGRDGR